MREADKPQPEFTARDAAKHMIRPYVRRGDDIQWLKQGQMGVASHRYYAQIGGYMVSWHKLANEKRTKLKPDQVGVSRLGDVEMHQIFPLPELYQEVKDEDDPTKYKQAKLF